MEPNKSNNPKPNGRPPRQNSANGPKRGPSRGTSRPSGRPNQNNKPTDGAQPRSGVSRGAAVRAMKRSQMDAQRIANQ
jgi:hypothetical protein